MLPPQYSKKETPYFCRFTFGQFFTLLVLEIFTLFFIFYLGARYGGELLGVKTQAPQIATESSLPTLTMTDPNVVATTQDPEIQNMAKDLLDKAPTSDLKQRVQEMLQESSARKTPLPVKPRTTAELKTAPRPTTPPKPETAVASSPKPATSPVIETAPSAPYSVQVGSYPNPDEAHTIVDSWKAKGYSAYLVSADIPGRGRWYRVRLGGFDTKEEANTFLSKLQHQEGVEAFVVTNE